VANLKEELLGETSMATARRRTQRTSRSGVRQAARNAAASGIKTPVMDTEESHASHMRDWQIEMKHIYHDLRELMIISVSLFALLFIVGYLL
jgi:hypothetical protein